MTTTEFWYRYEASRRSSIIDAEREEYGVSIEPSIFHYPVIRHTEHGVFLQAGGRQRFVLRRARRRFACPTLGEALESYLARKTRQVSLLQAQIEQVREGVAAVLRLHGRTANDAEADLQRLKSEIDTLAPRMWPWIAKPVN